jgi:glycosyltransferase involved in cell wall biosynthesis
VALAAIVSYRLDGPDGVSVEAAKWGAALRRLGWTVRTIAGEGRADVVLPGLAMNAGRGPHPVDLERAWSGADVVVVENVCSLPLNPAASTAVAHTLKGRSAVLHHHDLPWQRPAGQVGGVPVADDRQWRHVVINDLSRRELAARGIQAVTIRNAFDVEAKAGDRATTRAALGLGDDERLLVQPTRAIARKNVPAALALAEALGATYWLVGPAEEDYGDELARLFEKATVRWIHGPRPGRSAPLSPRDVADAYSAADMIVLPSTWEGFGNPALESAVFGRPLAIGDYPVAAELRSFGFRWFDVDDAQGIAAWFAHPDPALLDHNRAVAARSFSFDMLDRALSDLLSDLRSA